MLLDQPASSRARLPALISSKHNQESSPSSKITGLETRKVRLTWEEKWIKNKLERQRRNLVMKNDKPKKYPLNKALVREWKHHPGLLKDYRDIKE